MTQAPADPLRTIGPKQDDPLHPHLPVERIGPKQDDPLHPHLPVEKIGPKQDDPRADVIRHGTEQPARPVIRPGHDTPGDNPTN